MQVSMNTVVTMTYELKDADGVVLESSDQPVAYLHGGYDNIFPKVEEAMHGKNIGDTIELALEPADAFGDYDPDLLKIEPRSRFPEPLEVGMQFEGLLDDDETPVEEEDDEDPLIYTVTDLAEDKVVLDGNHPLAGLALKFWLVVSDVREATEEELEDGHPQGAFGLDVDDDSDMDVDEEPPAPPVVQRPTLH